MKLFICSNSKSEGFKYLLHGNGLEFDIEAVAVVIARDEKDARRICRGDGYDVFDEIPEGIIYLQPQCWQDHQ